MLSLICCASERENELIINSWVNMRWFLEACAKIAGRNAQRQSIYRIYRWEIVVASASTNVDSDDHLLTNSNNTMAKKIRRDDDDRIFSCHTILCVWSSSNFHLFIYSCLQFTDFQVLTYVCIAIHMQNMKKPNENPWKRWRSNHQPKNLQCQK